MDASAQIDEHIAGLPAWQSDYLRAFRTLIHEADPDVVEAWKWSTPVYLHGKVMLCATGVFKEHVKINFFKGALLPDQSHFNAGLDSKQSRAIDFHEGDEIDAAVIRSLVSAAVQLQ